MSYTYISEIRLNTYDPRVVPIGSRLDPVLDYFCT